MLRTMKLSVFALLLAGCSHYIRSPEQYRDDTAAVLESKSGEIKACYDQALQMNKEVAGTVKVKFTVKGETGKVMDPQVETDGTTAPPELQSCVTGVLANVALEPPDDNDGFATYTWEFSVGETPPAPPADPAAMPAEPKKPAGMKSTGG